MVGCVVHMMTATMFLWLWVYSVAPKFHTPVISSGLGTFLAAYRYLRIVTCGLGPNSFTWIFLLVYNVLFLSWRP